MPDADIYIFDDDVLSAVDEEVAMPSVLKSASLTYYLKEKDSYPSNSRRAICTRRPLGCWALHNRFRRGI